jgi:hypothetical protein
MTELLTPTEVRQRLAVVRDRAITADLIDDVRRIDASLMIAAHLAINSLSRALADAPLAATHAGIIKQLDTPDTESTTTIPAPRRPGITPPPASAPAKPAMRPQRRATGPDRFDLEIPV